MPYEFCQDCGSRRFTCPNCGDHKVTPFDNGFQFESVKRWLVEANDGDEFKFNSVCWECGWKVEKSVSVEVD